MRHGLLELELELHPHWRLQMTAVKWGQCRALGTSQLSICGTYHRCSSLNSFINTKSTARSTWKRNIQNNSWGFAVKHSGFFQLCTKFIRHDSLRHLADYWLR